MSTSSVSSVSGVYSGIDWQSTIDALMQVESRRVTILETRQSNEENRLNAWRNINSRLVAFETAMDEMQDLENFLVHSATSSDSDILQATASSGSAEGTYAVLVDQLATSSRLIHEGWADVNSTALNSSGGDQTFSYTHGTGDDAVTRTLTVANGATLADLVSLINSDADNPGVQATILNDGSGGATAYHLVLSSQDTGVNSQIVIDDAGTTVAGFLGANIEQSQVGQNARIRVDGYPAAGWIESESNLVEDVITGVTLSLKDVSAGEEVQVTVSADKDAVRGKIDSFVSSYNEVIGLINTYTSYDDENEAIGILLGDSGLAQLERNLSRLVSRPLTGLSSSAVYTSLAEIGVRTGDGGLLKVDEEKLDAALENNFSEIGNLFSFSSRTSNSHVSFFTRTDNVPAGEVAVSLNYNAAGELTGATMNGETARINGNFILGAEGGDYEGLQLRFTNPGDGGGTIDATVTLGFGVAAAFQQTLSALTDSDSGLVQFQTTRLESSLEDLARSIEDMNTRLEDVRAKYEREFLAMETAISRLQSQASALTSLGS